MTDFAHEQRNLYEEAIPKDYQAPLPNVQSKKNTTRGHRTKQLSQAAQKLKHNNLPEDNK